MVILPFALLQEEEVGVVVKLMVAGEPITAMLLSLQPAESATITW